MLYAEFISYYPLKQGLKQISGGAITLVTTIYILLSIKTRIETLLCIEASLPQYRFISYYPLKQGLKRETNRLAEFSLTHLYPTIH